MCASMRHFLWWSCGQWRDVVVVDGVAGKSVIAVVFDDDDDGSLRNAMPILKPLRFNAEQIRV